jgi:hypothetical protein
VGVVVTVAGLPREVALGALILFSWARLVLQGVDDVRQWARRISRSPAV